ncbi:MAG: HlyD family secretion protein [Parvibaculum sp.]|uniref:HlyD family secretion protein n=1 Tax=Parvibaculum sp. TaxID=2024848 RepID=UPI0025CC9F5E|nr:HlyD family secretion protein [Parvibaculum sp.]MCE9648615.1 HlyD family secretion protein [Parvibaculum sp.]
MATRQRIFIGLGGLFLLAGLVYAVLWLTHYRYIQTTDNAYVESDISVISPKVTGYLATVNIVENAYVHKDDVLATIAPRDFEIALAQAAAKLESQKAAIGTIVEQIAAAEASAESARATITSADAQARRARADYARYTQLAKESFASKQKLESARADTQSAAATLKSAEANSNSAIAQIAVLRAQKVEAEAALKQAEAAVDQARRDLDYTVIRAPVDGVVGNKHLDIGQLVQPGAQLASLVALPHVYIEANFKETQIENIRVGQTATIVSDAYPGTEIEGTVESFSPASGQVFSLLPAENATGNFTKVVQRVPVRIAVPDENALRGLLRPGLSVYVSVDTRSGDKRNANASGVYGTPGEPLKTLARDN